MADKKYHLSPPINDVISPVMKRHQLISGQTAESAKLVG